MAGKFALIAAMFAASVTAAQANTTQYIVEDSRVVVVELSKYGETLSRKIISKDMIPGIEGYYGIIPGELAGTAQPSYQRLYKTDQNIISLSLVNGKRTLSVSDHPVSTGVF